MRPAEVSQACWRGGSSTTASVSPKATVYTVEQCVIVDKCNQDVCMQRHKEPKTRR